VAAGTGDDVDDDVDEPFTLAFVGYADAGKADQASAYEDEVLPLLEDHGARVVYRGRRTQPGDDTLPLEVHLLRFPHRAALDAYLADPRRQALLDRYGDVFTTKHSFEIATLAGSVD
jgi:uncharacterized protein (DUF1330 family)